jgi:hypothetical protein
MRKKYIGGEYFYSPSILFQKKKFDLDKFLAEKYPNKYFYYTGGGYYSIIKIIKEIGFENNQEILLPSYLCPSILIPFQKLNIEYRFYKINENLEIDINDLERKITKNTKAIFFINYFGFPQKEQTLKKLKEFKQQEIILIEDIVQSFFSNIIPIGNYIFNSFRKHFPVDGSIIISENKFESFNNKGCLYNSCFIYKLVGRFLRYLQFEYNFKTEKLFLYLFKKAEDNYYRYSNTNFTKYNRFLLSRYNIPFLVKKRKENFKYLLNRYSEISIYKKLEKDIVPLGFPILIQNRNKIRKKLISKNIFCPIHWILPDEIDKNEFKDSWYLSEHLLTIPINENFGVAEYEYFKKYWGISHEYLSKGF